ncbi:MAG: MarR family transcriptional regulator [Rhizobiales bacterium]|nr:MarR family transcriptional regulator [Hyphomicrobiales bacterium]
MQQPTYPGKGLGILVHDVGRLMRRLIDAKAQSLGLTSAQWRVMSAVYRAEYQKQEPLNQAALADQMDVEPITLSRQIDRMQAAGLIERRPDPGDRRAYRLFLTEEARPLVAEFRAIAGECVNEALAGVTDAEIDLVNDVLSRIRANLVAKPEEKHPEPERPAAAKRVKETNLT